MTGRTWWSWGLRTRTCRWCGWCETDDDPLSPADRAVILAAIADRDG